MRTRRAGGEANETTTVMSLNRSGFAGALLALSVAASSLVCSGATPAAASASTQHATQQATQQATGQAISAEAPRGGRPVTLALDSIQPEAPGPESVVRITGHLTAGKTGVDQLSVRLRFSSNAFVSRGVMNAYAHGQATDVETSPLYDTEKLVTPHLSPGQSVPFALSVPVAKLGLSEFGVYPLGIEVRSGEDQVVERHTFLPFVPEGSRLPPTRAAWLWPVIDRPHRAVGPGFTDDQLADRLAPDRRLGRLVDAASSAPAPPGQARFPLVWAVDPALLQAVQDMTDGYDVQEMGSSKVTEHEESTVAKEWLSRLQTATADGTVLSVPYADPDVVALHRAGLDNNLSFAVTGGPALTQQVLHREVASDVVWPPGGWLNQGTLDTLSLAGTDTVILNERSLPTAEPLTYTANSATSTPTVGGQMNVLVADSALTRILGSARKGGPGSAVLARQRFLAETALITDERPYAEGTLLIAPPRRWNPPPGFAGAILADSAQVPWLHPVGLSYLRDHPSTAERSGLHYSPDARANELNQRHLKAVKSIYSRLQHFTSILETRTSVFDYALLRTESSAWRPHPAKARRLRETVQQQLQGSRDDVRILPKERVVLTSNAATVPITIANDLTDSDLTVTVGLKARPKNRARLDVGNIPKRIQILPDHKRTIRVRMEAVTSGATEVTLQLTTPQGQNYGEPVRLDVQATGYGTAALGVTGGALGLLFLAVAVRLIRRALKSRQSGPADETEEQA